VLASNSTTEQPAKSLDCAAKVRTPARVGQLLIKVTEVSKVVRGEQVVIWWCARS